MCSYACVLVESERDEEHDVKANKKEADLQHRQAELQRRETLYQQDKDACHKNRSDKSVYCELQVDMKGNLILPG